MKVYRVHGKFSAAHANKKAVAWQELTCGKTTGNLMSEFLKWNLDINILYYLFDMLFEWFNKPAIPKNPGVCHSKIVSVTKNLNLCKLSLTVAEKTVERLMLA
jgi:hypothetical protein